MPVAGALIFRPYKIGLALNERGDPMVTGEDGEGLAIALEMTPDAFKALLAAAPRLRGIGIAVENRVHVVGSDELVKLNGDL
jgi:hypothetical protein